jgi:hypothetical protein
MARTRSANGFLLLAAAVLCLAPSALALPEAGSVLIFPLYDSSPGAGTVISITNTQTGRSACPDGKLEGDVLAHFTYIDGESCSEFDRFEFLTPGDNFTVLADEHNPQGDKGFLVVLALSPSGALPVHFNHLTGQAIVVQSHLDLAWSYNAVTFQALAGDGSNPCDRTNPDLDHDWSADFDGVEYAAWPRQVSIPMFFEEGDRFGNRLYLMSTAIYYESEVSILFYNNSETQFSKTFRFGCWWEGALSDISAITTNLEGDPDETGHGTQAGWLKIRGTRARDGSGNIARDPETNDPITPAILGVFMQFIENSDFESGDVLFGSSETMNGLDLP